MRFSHSPATIGALVAWCVGAQVVDVIGAPGPTRTGGLRFRKSPAEHVYGTAFVASDAPSGPYPAIALRVETRPDAFAPIVKPQFSHNEDPPEKAGPVPPSTAPLDPAQERGLRWPWYAWAVGGQLADFASTRHFLATGRLVEGNERMRGIVQTTALFVAVKAGAGLLAAFVGDLMVRHGDARGLRWMSRAGRALAGLVGGHGLYHAIRNEVRLARAS